MQEQENKKPVIGITMGDYNGIGPETILKMLADIRIADICTVVVYGSAKAMNSYRKLLGIKKSHLFEVKEIKHINEKKFNLVSCCSEHDDPNPGKPEAAAGKAAFESLECAVKDLKEEKIDGLVTGPINKQVIQQKGFAFPGHTEFLANRFNADTLMIMADEHMKVAVVTGHVSLESVPKLITKEKIAHALKLLTRSLKKDYGILKPKVAVMGLNPHAGEQGLLGVEEQYVIEPALEEAREQGHLVFGPYPADGFFGQHKYTKFDAVLAMYHDQGLIPFKALAGERGVNVTAGMPAVRTSPAHGTAYDLAGQGVASEQSLRSALFAACDIVKQRKLLK